MITCYVGIHLMDIRYHKVIILRTSLLWHVCILAYSLVSTERTNNVSRIIGGYSTRHSQFPSFARLVITLSGGRRMQCGSTYIHPEWILTASHCLDWNFGTKKKPTIGKQRRIHAYMSLPMRKRRSIKIILHPDYIRFFKTNATYYDIGLLKISNPFPLSPFVGISTIAAKIESNADVEVIGYGQMKEGGIPHDLQVVQLRITQMDKTALICSDPDGKNFCSGDSGGPMYLKSTTELAGVISSTYKQCSHGIGIYVNVLSYFSWIKKTAHIHLTTRKRSNSCMGSRLRCWHTIFVSQFVLLCMFRWVESKS